MPYKPIYHNYRHDLSGSLTKNRYRYELYWGINKIYELYQTDEDFYVVFDYASDIDVIINGNFEFYQLKTKNTNITLSFLTKKSGADDSILYKLSKLDSSQYVNKLAVVSNAKFNCLDDKTREQQEIKFSELKTDEISKIKDHSKPNQINGTTINKMSYIRSNIPLNKTDDNLLGSTTIFLQNVLKTKMIDPVFFRNYIQDKIMTKATNEFYPSDFFNAIEQRGVTREDINSILDDYMMAYHPESEMIYKNIEKYTENDSYISNLNLKKSFSNLTSLGTDSLFIRNNVKKVIEEFKSDTKYQEYEFKKLTLELLQNVKFVNILDDYDKICFIFMAFNKLGGNDFK